MRGRLDRLGALAAPPLLAALALPFLTLRENRIAPAEAQGLGAVFGPGAVWVVLAVLVLAGLMLRLRRPGPRLALLALAMLGLLAALGLGARALLADAPQAARVAPGAGFWLASAMVGLLVVDAVARLRPGPGLRATLLAGAVALAGLVLASGWLADLSIAAEYRARAPAFWRAGRDHLVLAFGSFAAAGLVGLPLGLAIQRGRGWRQPVLAALTLVQTIPSIALFGLLIAPLAWLAAHVPLAARLGVAGIGMAPAMIALFLYSLLPIVANTVAGLDAVPDAARDAAAGMGMTEGQRLALVGLPLALPAILAGARIVLVQNIGLAAVGALIGAGGFGSFIFQGIGQTAADLILLGVLPIVALAFLTTALMDLAIATAARGAP